MNNAPKFIVTVEGVPLDKYLRDSERLTKEQEIRKEYSQERAYMERTRGRKPLRAITPVLRGVISTKIYSPSEIRALKGEPIMASKREKIVTLLFQKKQLTGEKIAEEYKDIPKSYARQVLAVAHKAYPDLVHIVDPNAIPYVYGLTPKAQSKFAEDKDEQAFVAGLMNGMRRIDKGYASRSRAKKNGTSAPVGGYENPSEEERRFDAQVRKAATPGSFNEFKLPKDITLRITIEGEIRVLFGLLK